MFRAWGQSSSVLTADVGRFWSTGSVDLLSRLQRVCVVLQGQVPRQESCPASSGSQDLLDEALRQGAPYPMVMLPSGGGYWADGHEPPSPPPASLAAPPHSWRTKFETDDTAKCYRRFFLGRVSYFSFSLELSYFELIVNTDWRGRDF